MSQENLELVRRAYEAFNAQDSEALQRLWAEQGEWRPAFLAGGIVEGAVYYGKKGVAEFIASQAETWQRVTARPIAMRDLGDHVLVEVRASAVGRIGGTPVERTTWHIWEVGAGEIRSGCAYLTEKDALEAVGLSE